MFLFFFFGVLCKTLYYYQLAHKAKTSMSKARHEKDALPRSVDKLYFVGDLTLQKVDGCTLHFTSDRDPSLGLEVTYSAPEHAALTAHYSAYQPFQTLEQDFALDAQLVSTTLVTLPPPPDKVVK
jgi:hypothetical protein